MNIRNNKLLPFTSQYRVIKVLFAFSKGEIKVILPIYARYKLYPLSETQISQLIKIKKNEENCTIYFIRIYIKFMLAENEHRTDNNQSC